MTHKRFTASWWPEQHPQIAMMYEFVVVITDHQRHFRVFIVLKVAVFLINNPFTRLILVRICILNNVDLLLALKRIHEVVFGLEVFGWLNNDRVNAVCFQLVFDRLGNVKTRLIVIGPYNRFGKAFEL